MATININVGVLGHVDSGKTSLSKALSRIGSTAAFDKNPQSQARGITLDLGFSAFDADVSGDEAFVAANIGRLQFTLVDCPGHASLIRTVLGGAQIIDVMILLVDVTKGIQTQTAECIVVGEILSRRLIVVVNKVDAVQGVTEEDKANALQKSLKRLRATFARTRWPKAPFIETAANPGAGEGDAAKPAIGMDKVTSYLVDMARRDVIARRIVAPSAGPTPPSAAKDLLMLVDHCFAIKGQGTVLTGTVLQGAVRVGDDVFLPDFQQTKRVKGIQMFKRAVTEAKKGDRVGVCVTQFAAEQMERGIVCGVGGRAVTSIRTAVARIHKVRFHTMAVEAGLKYHITIGHSTVMGTLRFFSRSAASAAAGADGTPGFDFAGTYDAVDDLPEGSQWVFDSVSGEPESFMPVKAAEIEYYAVVQLEHAVTAFTGASMIVSRLDADVHATTCRIAAHGTILTGEVSSAAFPATFPPEDEPWRMINVVKPKRKLIAIDRVLDERTCISKSVTAGSQNQDPSRFVGAKVALRKVRPSSTTTAAAAQAAPAGAAPTTASTVEEDAPVAGVIEAPFGKTGKVRIRFAADVFDKPAPRTRAERRGGRGGKGGKGGQPADAAAAEDEEEEDQAEATIAGDKATDDASKSNGRARIEIELAYLKYPFATKHRQ
jgi:selenocysteine-specific elongation factor